MISIGIIANPASGKDIRRLVSHATIIDNNEKINIIERIILGAQALGVEKVYMMPDSFHLGHRAEEKLKLANDLKCEIEVINMYKNDTIMDTIRAAAEMEKVKVGCIVVLGGDGTNRAVAKSVVDTPLISISTGTNNAYPVMMEGTIAGMAAAVAASGKFDEEGFINREKRIEIFKNNQLEDIALVDAVISKEFFVGSKAIWDSENIEKVIVSRCHPASIGFSAIVGSKAIVLPEDNFGAWVNMNDGSSEVYAAMAAGIVTPVSISDPEKISLGEDYRFNADERGTIALDGEREIQFSKGDEFIFRITRQGPRSIDTRKALAIAQEYGFFKK